jgi:hypothetical protein
LRKIPLEEKLAEIFARQNEQLLETLELREQARSHFGIGTPLLPVAQRWLVKKKKKGNTKARALTEFEKAEIAEKSKGRANRAKPNEPETGSAQAAAVSSLTVPTWASATGLQLEFHADTAILGSIKRCELWKYWERGLIGQGSQQRGSKTLRELVLGVD